MILLILRRKNNILKLFSMYSEVDITWSSIEKYVPYDKVIWHTKRNGIPVYTFLDENGSKIDVNFEECLNSIA